MNYRKRKQLENYNYNKTFFPKKKMYTPEGYLKDPPEAKCPYCGESRKVCSYMDSLSRSWGRQACAYIHKNKKIEEQ